MNEISFDHILFAPGVPGSSLLKPHLELLLDQDEQVALVLQVPCGQLGVRAASPKDIRLPAPLIAPPESWCKTKRENSIHPVISFWSLTRGFRLGNESKGTLWKKLGVKGNGPSGGQENAQTAPGSVSTCWKKI